MRSLGLRGEEDALAYLKGQGYRIIKRNYKAPGAEVDIIAMDKGQLVFVEVKARSGDEFGEPAEAVGARKQRKLKEAAECYLASLKRPEEMPSARFDIVGVRYYEDRPTVIDHIKDAFMV